MCSTAKGGTTKPFTNAKVDSLVGDMAADEYSDMVRRANAGYEKRQQELAERGASRKTQVADEIGISRITIDKIWEDLIKKDVIIKTRTMGRAELYKLNIANPKVKILMKIGLELASAYLKPEEKQAISLPA